VDDVAAIPVKDGTEIVKGAGNIEVSDVNVPVLMSLDGLFEAFSLAGGGRRPAFEQTGCRQDPVNAAGTDRCYPLIQHHIAQTAIPLSRMRPVVLPDGLFLCFQQPMRFGYPPVVAVLLPLPLLPGVILAAVQISPLQQAL